ncbi:MAG: alanine racemase [Reyranella sp.]|uniref:alanine racemase n=1 Tax=Reyranella sp. TaxID=1929291 RepID=UPI003D1394E6
MAALDDDPARRAGAILTIDLGAIAANWRGLRDAGRAEGRPIDCAAVLKADAYGTGAAMVGPRLAAEGCRQFFVAHLDEGIALRAVVPDHPICVLNGLLPGTDGDFVEHRLTPALNHLGQLNSWRAAAQRFNRPLDAIIHIDTGMHRLGFPPDEAQVLANERGRLRGLRLALLMSHLVASEEQANPVNGEQLSRFRNFLRTMPGAPASLANSSGIFLGPDYHFDLLRPGAALYGINPLPDQANPMLPVVSLHARILQTRRIDAFQTVGYGGAWRSVRPSRIATIALGYADGYFRTLIHRTHVYLAGHRVPVIGRISMDLVTIDVTDIPENECRLGATVEVLGRHVTAEDLADHARTNAYEVMTALGRRYARLYVDRPETAS